MLLLLFCCLFATFMLRPWCLGTTVHLFLKALLLCSSLCVVCCVCMPFIAIYLPIYLSCRLGGGAGAGIRDAVVPASVLAGGDAAGAQPDQESPARAAGAAGGAGGDGDGHGHHGGICWAVLCCTCAVCVCVCVVLRSFRTIPSLCIADAFFAAVMKVIEMETEEALRRTEINRADHEAQYKFNREVRQEKSHWKIASNRKNVILRNRPRYQAILAQVLLVTIAVLFLVGASFSLRKKCHVLLKNLVSVSVSVSVLRICVFADQGKAGLAVRLDDQLRAPRPRVGRGEPDPGEAACRGPARPGRREQAQNVRVLLPIHLFTCIFICIILFCLPLHLLSSPLPFPCFPWFTVALLPCCPVALQVQGVRGAHAEYVRQDRGELAGAAARHEPGRARGPAEGAVQGQGGECMCVCVCVLCVLCGRWG
jgi:hypothetical protein